MALFFLCNMTIETRRGDGESAQCWAYRQFDKQNLCAIIIDMIGRTNYAAYEIRYPFVWALKYRRNGLGGAILKRLTILLNEKTQERGDYRPGRPASSCLLVWSIPACTYLASEQARIEGIHRFYATP